MGNNQNRNISPWDMTECCFRSREHARRKVCKNGMQTPEKFIVKLAVTVLPFHLSQLLQRPIHLTIKRSQDTQMKQAKRVYVERGLLKIGSVASETDTYKQDSVGNQSPVGPESSTAAGRDRESKIQETNRVITGDMCWYHSICNPVTR